MTRWLVVVLLAVNLGFMAWMYHRLVRETPFAPLPAPVETGSIRLLSEVEAGGGPITPMPAEDTPESPAPGPAQAVDAAAEAQADPHPSEVLEGTPEVAAQAAVPTAEASDTDAGEPSSGTTPPGPWVGRESPAGSGTPAWRSLEQRVLRPVMERAEPADAPGAVQPVAAADRDRADGAAATTGDPVAAVPATAAALSSTEDTCLSLGPLLQEPSVQRLVAWVEQQGGQADARTEIIGRKDAHWMYLGPFKDLDTARMESDRLRDLGVKDHLAVRHEQLGPVVSLGLYGSVEGREHRVAALRAVGVEPVVVPRGPRTTRWWVDARFPASSGITPEALAAENVGDWGEVKLGDCPDQAP